MANLEQLVNKKTADDTAWKEQRQLERQNSADMRDAAIIEITTDPEIYARYLEMQGDNPTYSAGNIALAMFGLAEATIIGTRDRWKSLGRTVLEAEQDKGVKIFAKATYPARGYTLANAYDISQTTGRSIKEITLRDDTKQMEKALGTLLNYSPVPVVTDKEMGAPAYYDATAQQLFINPDYSDSEAFAAIATEIAHARLHNKGNNRYYDRDESMLDAESVSYILCRHFHIQRDLPDTSGVAQLYEGWETEERTDALDKIHEMSKQIGRSIERDVTPEQQKGHRPRPQPTR